MWSAIGVFAVVVVVIALLAAAKPSQFTIARSTRIAAPAGKILPLIEDFHRWTAWSPWESMDPDMQRSYAGAASGKGAIYSWEGKKAGAGRMEITEATPAKVLIDLVFTRPMKAQNVAEFALAPAGEATDVTWSMHGRHNVMMKLMSPVFDMDKLVGKDFEKGLAKLKAEAEAA